MSYPVGDWVVYSKKSEGYVYLNSYWMLVEGRLWIYSADKSQHLACYTKWRYIRRKESTKP